MLSSGGIAPCILPAGGAAHRSAAGVVLLVIWLFTDIVTLIVLRCAV